MMIRIGAVLTLVAGLWFGSAGTANALPTPPTRTAVPPRLHWVPCPDPRLMMACFRR
jgi:hypothetical protein